MDADSGVTIHYIGPMRFGPHLLDEILRRTDIVQLVGRRVKLARKGQAYWGCCPFHNEKSPSFKVENARRTYKCFGCGKGGDASAGWSRPKACPSGKRRAAGPAKPASSCPNGRPRKRPRGKEEVALRHHRARLRLLRGAIAGARRHRGPRISEDARPDRRGRQEIPPRLRAGFQQRAARSPDGTERHHRRHGRGRPGAPRLGGSLPRAISSTTG